MRKIAWGCLVGCLVAWTSVVRADSLNDAKTFGPYTITATGSVPSTAGERLSDYDDQCAVQIVRATGSISIDVEGSLEKSGAWVTLGTLTNSSLSTLQAPLDFVRFTTTAIGKLCVGGANDGNACTVASECPTGTCPAASTTALVRCRAGQ